MLFIGAIAGLALPQETSGAQLAESIESESARLSRTTAGDGDVELRGPDAGTGWGQLSPPVLGDTAVPTARAEYSRRLTDEDIAEVVLEDEDGDAAASPGGSAV
jgi:hypothetical protein